MEDYAKIALKIEDSEPALSFENVMLICVFQKETEKLSNYETLCESDLDRQCCPAWSLPNFIGLYRDKSDCYDLNVRFLDKNVFFTSPTPVWMLLCTYLILL